MQGSGKNKKENTGLSLVDLGYRRVKAAEAVKKALDAGKIVQKKAGKKSKPPPERTQSRTEEMRELFQRDMSERKQKRMEQETGSPRIHLRANQGTNQLDISPCLRTCFSRSFTYCFMA
jgi:ATP-dependent RNA helicase DDX27